MWDRKSPPKEPKLKRLDIMIDSFCNLKCIMCTNRSEVNGGFLNEFFWKELEENILPQLDEIEIIGGEPLIAKDTYRLMDLVLKVKPSIRWVITTNAHVEFGKNLTSRIEKLNIHSFAISIDSLNEENFRKIRDRGELSKCFDFINKLEQFKKEKNLNFYVVCNFLIQRDNYWELKDFMKFQKEQGIKVYPILLREPIAFSILTLKYDKLLELFDSYIDLAKIEKNIYIKNLVSKIAPSIKKIDIASRLDRIQEMAKYE
jgi:molybdenum cofactor biosynthesis enzyme MoaA